MEISFEDRQAIEAQLYRYGYTIDSGDVEGFVAVFTDDAVYDAVIRGQDEPLTRMEGAAGLRAAAERASAPGAAPFVHLTACILFDDLDSVNPRTRSTVIATAHHPSGATIDNNGVYNDRWRKTPEGWRIEYRRYVMTAPPGSA